MQPLSESRLKTWLVRFGIHDLLRPLCGGRGIVLALHRVRDPGDDLIFAENRANMIEPDRLARLVEELLAARVPIVSLDDALDRLRAKTCDRFICLTFDDGYVDNHDVLLPLLQRLGVPATIYITPGLLDGTAPLWWYGFDIAIARHPRVHLPLHRDIELPSATMAEKQRAFTRCLGFMLKADATARSAVVDALANRYGIVWTSLAAEHMMTWQQVDALAHSPLIEVGAHTLTHPVLMALDAADARAEMQGSRQRLAREVGKPIAHFAYPFGTELTNGPREARLASETGFRTAATTRPGNLFRYHARHAYSLPRHGLGPHDGSASLSLKRAGLSRSVPQACLAKLKRSLLAVTR